MFRRADSVAMRVGQVGERALGRGLLVHGVERGKHDFVHLAGSEVELEWVG